MTKHSTMKKVAELESDENDVLGRVIRVLEEELRSVMRMYQELKEECDQLERAEVSTPPPPRYEIIPRPLGPPARVRTRVPPPVADYPYRLTANSKVYCFSSLDELLSRVVVPPEVLRRSSPRALQQFRPPAPPNARTTPANVAQLIDQYINIRIDKIEMSDVKKRFMERFDKMIQEEYRQMNLVYPEVIKMIDIQFEKIKKRQDETKKDNLKLIIEKFYETGKEYNGTAHVIEAQNNILKALAKDLSAEKYPQELISEIYKLSCFLRHVPKSTIPLLVKNVEE